VEKCVIVVGVRSGKEYGACEDLRLLGWVRGFKDWVSQ
jgi:hypothetical protein